MTTWTRRQALKVVQLRSGGVCELDGWRRATCLSHRIAASRGGTWAPSNLLHLCGSGSTGCHGWLEDNPTWAGRGGWHIRRDLRTPDQVPAFLRHSYAGEFRWLLLDDAGGVEWVFGDDFGFSTVPEHLPPGVVLR